MSSPIKNIYSVFPFIVEYDTSRAVVFADYNNRVIYDKDSEIIDDQEIMNNIFQDNVMDLEEFYKNSIKSTEEVLQRSQDVRSRVAEVQRSSRESGREIVESSEPIDTDPVD